MTEKELIHLIYEILVGMRNAPVTRAEKIVEAAGYDLSNTKDFPCYEKIREDLNQAELTLHNTNNILNEAITLIEDMSNVVDCSDKYRRALKFLEKYKKESQDD